MLAPCFRNPPGDEGAQQGGKGGKDEIHLAAATQGLIEHGEKLADEKGGDPVRGEGAALGGADGFGADELVGEDEGDGTQADGEGGDEEEGGDGGEKFEAVVDADGKKDGAGARAGDAQQQAGFAPDSIGERGAEDRGDDVEYGDQHGEERRCCRE